MSHWKIRAVEKRRQQYESIPVQWRIPQEKLPTSPTLNTQQWIQSSDLLSKAEHELLSITDGRELQQKLVLREINAVEVVTAFCKSAAIAQQLTGCCTEMFFEKALARARWLDEEYERTGKVVGPLHGFPISFKDNFDVEGEDSTIGWVGKIGRPAKDNSMGVDLMLRLGAVVYVKSNIPQSLMMSDSYNHVFKQSLNALNRALISGGSSGGEGALVGANASLIGLGTDIGGSIRIPAVLQGLYGMSPSVGRVPNDPSGAALHTGTVTEADTENRRTQKYIVPPVAGPITSSLASMELYFESLLGSEPWNIDPGLLPIPWRTDLAALSSQKLKLGFIFDDGITKCQPPIERVAREMYQKLKAAGHEVFEWDSTSHLDCYEMWLSAVLADGGEDCKQLCKLADEPLVEGMLVGQQSDLLSSAQRQQLEERKTKYKRFYLKKWKDSGVDALIMPVTPYVNFPPKIWVKSSTCVSYTSQWNFLDYAALTIPAGCVDTEMDQPTTEWTNRATRNDADEFNKNQYDIDLVKNMPVGLQIVGGRFGEEICVRVAKTILEI